MAGKPVARPVDMPVASPVGAGEAAGAGRAAAMAGEGVAGAAAVAGPLALVVAASTVTAEAFIKVGKTGMELAKSQEQLARQNQVSPHLAAVNQFRDMQRQGRQIESGANQAGSYKELIDAVNRLEETVRAEGSASSPAGRSGSPGA